ncbi:kinase-like protein, partial [Ramaria rubella]
MTRETSNPLSAENLRQRGYHTLRSSFKPFHVENRWRLVRELGQGAYGMVVSAEDKISGETVAIKMVTPVLDKLQLAKRALREITLLRHFSTRGHENITGLIDLDAIHPEFTEIYIFMEPMEADLHQILRSEQCLTNEHIQYFLYQILRGMKYIHTASVIHRDLKPGNLLVNADCELKVCDFGLANTYEGNISSHLLGLSCLPLQGVNQLTEYVATRWYRAPEIMLSFSTYTTAISRSIGCILAELILGKPLFKGKKLVSFNYLDQLNRILDVLGSPDETIFDRISAPKAKAYMRSLPIRKAQPFCKVFPKADPQALDLLSKMITWDPEHRLSVIEALEHPYVSNYHDPDDEPSCPTKFDRYKDHESLTTLEEFRIAIWNEIQDFRHEVRSLHTGSLTPSPVKEAWNEEPH